jgi:Domain of unknown function (DUF4845)
VSRVSYWIVYPIVIAVELLDKLFARASRVVTVAAILAVCLVAWTLVPPYTAYWRLKDEVREVARRYAARESSESELRRGLMQAVRHQQLDASLTESDFEIESTPFRLRISCRYDVAVELFLGRQHRIHFLLNVEEPVLPRPDPIFI